MATARDQGARRGDFCNAVPGELVCTPQVCGRDAEDPDAEGACGCGRSWLGFSSGCHTTTAEVAELDLTREQYVSLLADAHRAEGLVDNAEWTTRAADELLDVAAGYDVGAVVGWRLGVVDQRA